MKKLSLFLTTLLLIGCGSGGSNSNSNTQTKTINGKVIDGYVKNATVCIDTNKNLKCDSNEIKTKTDKNGNYTLKVSNISNNYIIISTGGIDTETNKTAPTMYSLLKYQNITPITTLIANGLSENEVAQKLGINKEDIAKDPLKNSKLNNVAQKVVKLIQAYKVKEVVNELKNSNVNIDNVENFILNNNIQNSQNNSTISSSNQTQNSQNSTISSNQTQNPPSIPSISSKLSKLYINNTLLKCNNGKCNDITTTNTSYTFKLETPSPSNLKLGFDLYRYSNKTDYKFVVDSIKIDNSKIQNKTLNVCVEKAGNSKCKDIDNSKSNILEYNNGSLIINSQNIAKAFNKSIPNTKENFKITFYIEGTNIAGFIDSSAWGIGIKGFNGIFLDNPKKAEFQLNIK